MKKNHQKSGVMDLARGRFTRLAVLAAALNGPACRPSRLCAQESKPWEKIPVPPLRGIQPAPTQTDRVEKWDRALSTGRSRTAVCHRVGIASRGLAR